MKNKILAAGFKPFSVLILFLAALVLGHADTITWTNAAGGDWNVAANWNPNQVPGPSDTANLAISLSGSLTVPAAAVLNWNSGTLGSGVTLTVSSNALLNWNNGTVGAGASLTVASNAVVSWANGSSDGALLVAAGGALNITNSSVNYYFSGSLTNYGTVTWSGGGIYGYAGTVFYNAGLWDAQSDNTMGIASSSPLFINAGTFRKSGGTGTTTIGWPFTTTGVIDQQTGSLNFNWSGSNTLYQNFNGPITLSGGATLTLSSNVVLNWNGGTINSGSSLTALAGSLLNWNNGNVAAGASLTVASNAVVSWANGYSDGALLVAAGGALNITNNSVNYYFSGTLTNYGTVTWSGGGIYGYAGTVFYNGGLWDAQSDNTMGIAGSSPLFINAGTFRKSGGTGTTTIGWPFTTPGVIDQQTGFLNLNWSGDNTLHQSLSGPITLSGGATLTLASNVTLNWNGGTINSGSSLTASNGSLLNWNNGNVAAGASLTVASNAVVSWANGYSDGALLVAAGGALNITNNSVNYYFNGTLTNYGTVTWSGGGIYGYAGTVFYNAGLWDAQADNAMNSASSSPLFINAGTFRKSGGTGTTTVNWPFTTTGVIDQQTGFLNLNWSGDNTLHQSLSGPITLSGGATLTLASNVVLNWNSGTINSGSSLTASNGSLLNWNNGNVAAGASLTVASNAVVSWANGYSDGALLVAAGGALNITNSVNYFFNGTLTNYGTVTWSGGTLYGYAGTVFYNAGLWDAQADNSMNSASSSPLFINTGTFRKSGGTGTTTIGWPFTNAGILSAQIGTISLSGSYDLAGGTLKFGLNSLADYGKISLSGSATLTGTLAANLNSGYYPVKGDSFNVLSYGSQTGAFANFALPPKQAWSTNYGATLFTLSVSNSAPTLPAQTNRVINELTLLTVTNTAVDLDSPADTLTYTLLVAPTNASISAGGVITWTPNEAQGPGTNTFTTKVADNGSPSLSDTNTFTVVVYEVNVAPVLPAQTNRVIAELTLLTVTNTATDSDIPTNALAYALVQAPTNAAIDANGVITWTPTEAQGPSTNTFTTVVTDTNVFAVNAQSLTATNTFTVVVNEVNVAPVLFLPPNTNINELVAYTANATATDSDIPTNTLTFALVSGPANLTVSSAGVINWIPAEDQGPGTNTVTIKVTDSNPQAVNATSFSTTNNYTIIVKEVDVAPVLTLPPNTNINEQVAWSASATATDADVPTNTLTFALVSGPSGLTVSTAGVINWNPLENQGPSTNTVTISVTDTNPIAVNSTSFSVTNSFQIIVSEVNVAPVLTLPPNTNINEQVAFAATATATDADVPTNTLTFALVSGPSGLTVSSGGVINWTPSESQGPSTNTVTISVTDTNPVAVNATSLSVTNNFQIIVSEVNLAPVLPGQTNLTINEGVTLTVTNTASDADIPTNALTYSLLAAPGAATISTNGVITWVTTEADGPGTNTFTTKVIDNGSPNLSATNTFTVTVNEVNVAPTLPSQSDVTLNEGATLNVTNTASDSDIPANALTYSLLVAPGAATISTNGIITWLTTESDGPGTNTFKTKVTDNGSPALSATNTFTVIVNEVNVAPVLTLPPNTNINEQVAWSATATATDADIPANALTFALVSGPSGLTVSTAGVINWNPLENQGPGTNTVTIKVTDTNAIAVNTTSFSVTNSFQIIVSEVNLAPALPGQTNLVINEGVTLTVTNTASDTDVPTNALTYSLLVAPGAAVISTSGVITWITGEADGPSTNTFTTKVLDNGSPSLSATNTFTVVVNEVNVAPVVGTLTNRTVNPGQTISFTATATDADLPTNTLTFALVTPPAGATINGGGLFNWRPTVAQANTTNTVKVKVTDNGSPNLSGTNSFTVIVNPLAPVILTPITYTNGQFRFQVSGTTGPDYIIGVSTNLIQWSDVFTNLSPATPFEYLDTGAGLFNNRFYRARLSP